MSSQEVSVAAAEHRAPAIQQRMNKDVFEVEINPPPEAKRVHVAVTFTPQPEPQPELPANSPTAEGEAGQ